MGVVWALMEVEGAGHLQATLPLASWSGHRGAPQSPSFGPPSQLMPGLLSLEHCWEGGGQATSRHGRSPLRTLLVRCGVSVSLHGAQEALGTCPHPQHRPRSRLVQAGVSRARCLHQKDPGAGGISHTG